MSLLPSDERRPPAPAAGVDAICDAFEAAWLTGHEPRIEDFLPRGDSVHEDALFRELLLSEWDLRWRHAQHVELCLLYTSPSPRDGLLSRMPSSA